MRAKYPCAAGLCEIGSWCAFSTSILSDRDPVHNLLKTFPLCLPNYSRVEKWGALSLPHLKHYFAVPVECIHIISCLVIFLRYYHSKLLQTITTSEEIFFVFLYSAERFYKKAILSWYSSLHLLTVWNSNISSINTLCKSIFYIIAPFCKTLMD